MNHRSVGMRKRRVREDASCCRKLSETNTTTYPVLEILAARLVPVREVHHEAGDEEEDGHGEAPLQFDGAVSFLPVPQKPVVRGDDRARQRADTLQRRGVDARLLRGRKTRGRHRQRLGDRRFFHGLGERHRRWLRHLRPGTKRKGRLGMRRRGLRGRHRVARGGGARLASDRLDATQRDTRGDALGRRGALAVVRGDPAVPKRHGVFGYDFLGGDETSPQKKPRHALRLEATTLFRARAPLARALARRWRDASGVTMVGRRRTAKCVARARMAR